MGYKRGRDVEWIEHQNAFDKILAGLNAQNTGESTSPVLGARKPVEVPRKALVDTATEAKKLV